MTGRLTNDDRLNLESTTETLQGSTAFLKDKHIFLEAENVAETEKEDKENVTLSSGEDDDKDEFAQELEAKENENGKLELSKYVNRDIESFKKSATSSLVDEKNLPNEPEQRSPKTTLSKAYPILTPGEKKRESHRIGLFVPLAVLLVLVILYLILKVTERGKEAQKQKQLWKNIYIAINN